MKFEIDLCGPLNNVIGEALLDTMDIEAIIKDTGSSLLYMKNGHTYRVLGEFKSFTDVFKMATLQK